MEEFPCLTPEEELLLQRLLLKKRLSEKNKKKSAKAEIKAKAALKKNFDDDFDIFDDCLFDSKPSCRSSRHSDLDDFDDYTPNRNLEPDDFFDADFDDNKELAPSDDELAELDEEVLEFDEKIINEIIKRESNGFAYRDNDDDEIWGSTSEENDEEGSLFDSNNGDKDFVNSIGFSIADKYDDDLTQYNINSWQYDFDFEKFRQLVKIAEIKGGFLTFDDVYEILPEDTHT